MDSRWVAGNNLRGDLASVSVKENNLVRRLEAQDVATMMRFGPCQDKSVGVPIFRRDIKAMHCAASFSFFDSALLLPEKLSRAIEEAFAERSVFVTAEGGKFFELLPLLAVQT